MTGKRDIWADVLRSIAMFFVVFIHVSPLPQVMTLQNSLFFINFAIVKTCIALFFMLSGALLLGKEETYTSFFHKRFFKILIPWLVWTVIYILVQVIIQCKPIAMFSEGKYLFELTFLTKFWILPVLAGLYLLTPTFRILLRTAKTRDIFYLLFLWIIFVSLLPFMHSGETFPLSFPSGIFSQVMMCSGFFIGGYALNSIPKKSVTLSMAIGLTLAGIIITILSAIFHPQNIENIAYSIFAPGMILTAGGIFLVCERLSSKMERWSHKTKAIVTTSSLASFGVYLVHELVHDAFSYISIKNHWSLLLQTDLLTDYLRALIVFMLSIGVIMVLQKIPLIRKIVP